jgi:HlyD family secretion protein
MRRSSIRIVLAVLGVAVGVGLATAFVFRPWEASRPPAPIIGVAHQTEILIAPDVNGRMTSFRVAAGQAVRKGDILAVLSNPDLAAAVEGAKADLATARANQANVDVGVRKEEIDAGAQNVQIADANLAFAQQQYARAATLASKGFASRQQLDESTATFAEDQAALEQAKAVDTEDRAGPTAEERAIARTNVAYAEAALADAEASLAKTTLVAPVDGVVSLLVANPGEIISPGQPIMTLEAANERWFTFTIREDFLRGLTIGSPVRLLTANGDRIDAKVTELRPLGEFAVWRAARAVGDHDLNSFLLRADPAGEVRSAEPGMTVWIDRGAVN